MANASTYKPKGTILSPFDDSGKIKLKSIALPILEEFKASGKLDANTLIEYSKSINANISEVVNYVFELANEQSDITTNKLKAELKSLADSLASGSNTTNSLDDKSITDIVNRINLSISNNQDKKTESSSADNLDKLLTSLDGISKKIDDASKSKPEQSIVKESKEPINADLTDTSDITDKLTELKKEFELQNKDNEELKNNSEQTKTDILNTHDGILTQISDTLNFISALITLLQKSIENIRVKIPTISVPKIRLPNFSKMELLIKKISTSNVKFKFPKFKFPKFSFPKFKFPKFKFPSLKLPKLSMPKLKLPKLSMPKLKLPKLKLPKFKFPKLKSAASSGISSAVLKPIVKSINKVLLNLKQLKNFLNTLTNKLSKTIQKQTKQIIVMISKLLNVPIPKPKKKKKSKEETKLMQMVDKVNNFIDNFFNTMLLYVDKFLAEVTRLSKKYISKIMVHIFVWLLANVVLIGLLFALILNLIAEPLMKILLPIMDFINGLITKVIDFLVPIRDFLINVFKKVWEIISPVLEAFFKGLKPFAEAVARGLGLFVTSVLNVLKLFMDGIASGAKDLGQALVKFATAVVDVLADFMRGIATMAYDIGVGLGRFVCACVNVLADLMEGFGTLAKAIGEAIGKVVLGLTDVVELLVQFLQECVGILVAIVGTIRDFFEGIRSKAKAIGEMIGTIIYDFFKGFDKKAEAIGEAVADFVLETAKLMTKIVRAINNVDKIVRLYIIAPLKGFGRKIAALKVKAAEYKIWYPSGINFHGSINPRKWGMDWSSMLPFSFLTGGMSANEIQQAKQDADKSVSELVGDEMDKTEKAIAAEEEAEKAAALAAKLQQERINDLLKNQHLINDILALLKKHDPKIIDIYDITHTLVDEMINNSNSMKDMLELENSNTDKIVDITNNVSQVLQKLNEDDKLFDDDTKNYYHDAFEELKDGVISMREFLGQFSETALLNFDKMAEKIDNILLIPMPLMNTDLGNTALLENIQWALP